MNVEITDHTAFGEVAEKASAIVEVHGGRFLARGGTTESLKDDWTPSNRIVLIEFDSVEQAKAWWSSPAHTELRHELDHYSKTTATVIVGCRSSRAVYDPPLG